MKRFAMTVMLKDDPEIIRRYEAYHASPWPEVNAGLLKCGILRMFIYRFGLQLFMFMETADDFDMGRDLPKYVEDPKAREWDVMMADFQETVPGGPEGSKWLEMKEVYALTAP
jgi:L-rhamnose mutarotase